MREIPRATLKTNLSKYMKFLDLEKYQHDLIANLSFRSRPRVHLLLSILHQPQILLLGEPTNGLDPEQIYYLKKLIRSFKADRANVIISTHSLAFAKKIANRIISLKNGHLTAVSLEKDLEGIFIEN